MTLTGTQMNHLAAALHAAYPDVERYAIDSKTVRTMVSQLRDPLVAANDLTPGELAVVKWLWMRQADVGPALPEGDG